MNLEGMNAKRTLAEHGALLMDKDGELCNKSFNFAIVVGMLAYLSGHLRPEIEFAAHQCGWYAHNPCAVHKNTLKRIRRYLMGTRNRGMILTPTNEMKINCYVGADFAGLWSYKDPHDPTIVQSRTGYVMMFSGVPIIFNSKLQIETALSTMEVKYIALSVAMKELLPLR